MMNSSVEKTDSNFIIIVLLVLINIYYIYNYYSYKYSDNLDVSIESVEDLNYYLMQNIDINILPHSENKPYLLTIIFQNSCNSCIKDEIQNINKYYSQLEGQISVLFVGDDRDFLKEMGAEFEYAVSSTTEKYLGFNLFPVNPISVFFDSNFIYEIRIVDIEKPFSERFTALFYKKVHNFILGI